jgi:hypothetical protein
MVTSNQVISGLRQHKGIIMDQKYASLLNKATEIRWAQEDKDILFAKASPNLPQFAVTPIDLRHGIDLGLEYYTPQAGTPYALAEDFVRHVIWRKTSRIKIPEPTFLFKLGEADIVKHKLPPKVVGDWVIDAEIALSGEVKLTRSVIFDVVPNTACLLGAQQIDAEQTLRGWANSISISDYHESAGIALSLGSEHRFWSTSFSVTPGVPIRFEAAFEPKYPHTELIHCLDWDLEASLSCKLSGEIHHISSEEAKAKLVEDMKIGLEIFAGLLVGAIVLVIIIELAPEAIAALASLGTKLLPSKGA